MSNAICLSVVVHWEIDCQGVYRREDQRERECFEWWALEGTLIKVRGTDEKKKKEKAPKMKHFLDVKYGIT